VWSIEDETFENKINGLSNRLVCETYVTDLNKLCLFNKTLCLFLLFKSYDTDLNKRNVLSNRLVCETYVTDLNKLCVYYICVYYNVVDDVQPAVSNEALEIDLNCSELVDHSDTDSCSGADSIIENKASIARFLCMAK